MTATSIGFFAPRRPSIYRTVTNNNISGSSSVANVNQADADTQGVRRIIPEQGVLTIYGIYHF